MIEQDPVTTADEVDARIDMGAGSHCGIEDEAIGSGPHGQDNSVRRKAAVGREEVALGEVARKIGRTE